jgi:hypothetical protein
MEYNLEFQIFEENSKKAAIHFLPCKIDTNKEANITEYFSNKIRNKGLSNLLSFYRN